VRGDLQADRLKFWGLEVPEGRVHGPNSRSRRVYGCKCLACVPSGKTRPAKGEGMPQAERNRRLRQAKKGKPVPPTVKHGKYAYRTYGCRCDVCRAASERARSTHTWERKTHGVWTEGPRTTTLCWPPRNAGPDWRCDCGRIRPHLEAS